MDYSSLLVGVPEKAAGNDSVRPREGRRFFQIGITCAHALRKPPLKPKTIYPAL